MAREPTLARDAGRLAMTAGEAGVGEAGVGEAGGRGERPTDHPITEHMREVLNIQIEKKELL